MMYIKVSTYYIFSSNIIYQNPKLGCSVTVFEVNDVHYTSKRSDITIMDRLNVPTKMNQNYGRSFLLASYQSYEVDEKAAKMSDRNFDSFS